MQENLAEIVVMAVPEELLPTDVFWRGPPSEVDHIDNIPAREAAREVASTGQPVKRKMWLVYPRYEGESDLAALANACKILVGRAEGRAEHEINQAKARQRTAERQAEYWCDLAASLREKLGLDPNTGRPIEG